MLEPDGRVGYNEQSEHEARGEGRTAMELKLKADEVKDLIAKGVEVVLPVLVENVTLHERGGASVVIANGDRIVDNADEDD